MAKGNRQIRVTFIKVQVSPVVLGRETVRGFITFCKMGTGYGQHRKPCASVPITSLVGGAWGRVCLLVLKVRLLVGAACRNSL